MKTLSPKSCGERPSSDNCCSVGSNGVRQFLQIVRTAAGQHCHQRRGNQNGSRHVHKPRHGAGRIVRVQCAQDQMAVSDAWMEICAVSKSRISPT